MCFHISTKASTQSRNNNTPNKFVDYYHVSGFDHPKIGLLYNGNIITSHWGLIPHWVRNEQQALLIRNKTLNARIETLESKPSFKDVSFKRGILFVDGFFEFKHEKSRKIPHFIFNDNPIGMGTILSEWINPSTGEIISTFSIVTHKASNVLKSIHNNPKLKEPRSPLFIDINNKSSWINDNDLNYLHNISGEIEQNLKFHEVNKLSGSFYPGNNPSVLKAVTSQTNLFN